VAVECIQLRHYVESATCFAFRGVAMIMLLSG